MYTTQFACSHNTITIQITLRPLLYIGRTLHAAKYGVCIDQEYRVTEWVRTASKDAVLTVDEDVTATIIARDAVGYVLVAIKHGGVTQYYVSYSTRNLVFQ